MIDAAPLADRLALAEWRRLVAALYGEVRERSTTDPVAAWDLWRATRERLYREHPQSPVPPTERVAFTAHHWPYDPRLRFVLPVTDAPARDEETGSLGAISGVTAAGGLRGGLSGGGIPIVLPSSGADVLSFTRIGAVEVPFPGGRRRLSVFWLAGYAGGLFIPFRDATNGSETYGAGRYLVDGAKSADLGGDVASGTLVLDFNFAFQPSCAFDPKWSCPLAPPENRLDLRIEAGERLAKGAPLASRP